MSIFDEFTQELTGINEIITKSIADYPKAAATKEGKEKTTNEINALFSQVMCSNVYISKTKSWNRRHIIHILYPFLFSLSRDS